MVGSLKLTPLRRLPIGQGKGGEGGHGRARRAAPEAEGWGAAAGCLRLRHGGAERSGGRGCSPPTPAHGQAQGGAGGAGISTGDTHGLPAPFNTPHPAPLRWLAARRVCTGVCPGRGETGVRRGDGGVLLLNESPVCPKGFRGKPQKGGGGKP